MIASGSGTYYLYKTYPQALTSYAICEIFTFICYPLLWYNKLMIKDEICNSDPELMGGTPVFVGTRVPVETFFDYIEAGDSIDDFLEGFPTVTKTQVIRLLEQAREAVIEITQNSTR